MATTQNYSWPSSADVTVTGIGNPTGAPVPTDAVYVAGKDPSGNLKALNTDASGNLDVDLVSVGGAAIALGQTTKSASIPVALASDTGALPVSQSGSWTISSVNAVNVVDAVDSLGTITGPIVLPTGASTAALQTQISGQLPSSLGTHVTSASLAVNIASDQTVPVSVASLPLPSGGATAANQATGNASLASIDGKLASLGQKAMAGSEPVVIASDQSAIPVSQSGTWNITNISGVVSLPTGAATEATLAAASAKLPATLGQKAMAASLAVAIASDQSAIPVSQTAVPAANGRAKVGSPVYTDYSSTNVTTGAYVQIVASTAAAINVVEIFDSSGQPIYLAVGAAASEINQLIIIPGGNGQVALAIPSGSRISYKAVASTASSGINILNMYS